MDALFVADGLDEGVKGERVEVVLDVFGAVSLDLVYRLQ